jgi:hypothetical protein
MNVVVTVDLGFCDSGKGTMVDYLAQKANWIVRYNSGSQCGHNVQNKNFNIVSLNLGQDHNVPISTRFYRIMFYLIRLVLYMK